MGAQRVIRKKMGELLIERNIITKEQLNIALEEQKKRGGYISERLISLGFATELDIANCLSSQYGFAYLPLENYSIPREVLEIIPLKFIKKYAILPVDKMFGVLSIAMADPLNESFIEMLKEVTNCDIAIFISTYSEINKAIERYFGDKTE